ncbi:MAG: poly(3-hydroxyalkanoate) synthetase, partial [Mycobacterium sp.]|nr:poly(3-hydroxyalkanoate) synthetase [Mycobacterium sp.]
MTNPRVDDLDVNRHVAETGSRLHARLAEVSSQLRQSLEEDIPELRAGAGLLESVEKITGSDRTHLQASCSGGILAAMTAQHLTATGQGDRLASL